MSIALQVKKGDTRDWRFVISDSAGTALDLTSATVEFRVRKHEWGADNLFPRVSGTGGTNSDYISISDASGGIVRVTPRATDWADVSDSGVYVAEFKITDSAADIMFVRDVEVDFQEALW